MKSAATIMIKRPGALAHQGRVDIATWLRKQAANLVKYGHVYVDDTDFRASFNYTEKK